MIKSMFTIRKALNQSGVNAQIGAANSGGGAGGSDAALLHHCPNSLQSLKEQFDPNGEIKDNIRNNNE